MAERSPVPGAEASDEPRRRFLHTCLPILTPGVVVDVQLPLGRAVDDDDQRHPHHHGPEKPELDAADLAEQRSALPLTR